MNTHSPTGHQEPFGGETEEQRLVLALTIIAHPDARRVGNVARLAPDYRNDAGSTVWAISRETLRFATPYTVNEMPLEVAAADTSFRSFVSNSRPLCIEVHQEAGEWRACVYADFRAAPCGCQRARPEYHTLYANPGSASLRNRTAGSIGAATNDPSEQELCRWLTPVHAPREYSQERLREGIVLLYCKHVGLLLHTWNEFLPQDSELSTQFQGLIGTRLPPGSPFPGVIGESGAIRQARREIRRVAARDGHVLILGETGTGKEPSAQAIHLLSGRHGAWNQYNMGNSASDPAFQGTTLFGRADTNQDGLIAKSKGGTLFLDEIGNSSPQVQQALLTFLDDGLFTRLGSATTERANTRIVAATNKDPEGLLADLLPRFSLVVRLSPLRLRRDDIGRLLFYFVRSRLKKLDAGAQPLPDLDHSRPPSAWLSAPLVCAVASMPLRKNVRDLRNLAEQLVTHHIDEPVCDLFVCRAELGDLAGPGQSEEGAPRPFKPQGPSTGAPGLPPDDTAVSKLSGTSDHEILERLRQVEFVEAKLAGALGLSPSDRYALRSRLRAVSGYTRFADRTFEQVLKSLQDLQRRDREVLPDLGTTCRSLRVSRKELKTWITQNMHRLTALLDPEWVRRLSR